MISPVYFSVLSAVIAFGWLAESDSRSYTRPDGTLWDKPNRTAATSLTCILIFVAGFRYSVGTDFPAYYTWPKYSWFGVFTTIVTFQEGGFHFLATLSKTIWSSGQSVIFFSSLVTVGLYCRTIYRYSSMYFLSMLLYLFMGEWQGSFNAVRQYVAAAIVFSGHRLILEQNIRKYLGVIFLAALFHKSAIVMCLPYFILTRKPSHGQIVLLALGAIVLRFSYAQVFDVVGELKGTEMNVEGDEYLSNDVNTFRILVAFIPVAVYLLQCRKTGHTKEQDFYINALIFNAFTMLAAAGSCYLARIGAYTNATSIIGYGSLFSLIDDEKNRKTTMFGLLAMYLIYWYHSVRILRNGTFEFGFG